MSDKEYRFPLYTTEPVVTAVQHLVDARVDRLMRLKRLSKAQRTELEQLRAASKELAAAWGDMEPVD